MYRSLASKVAVTAGLALLWSAPASAQTPQEWREADEGSQHEGGLILEQVYHGVLPGTGNTLPRVEELRTKTGTWVTWPGFFMLPSGGSRIFIQTTSRLDYNRKDKKRTLVLHFDDASVFLDNNRNPLVTIHFNTPVRSAFLKKRRKGVDLVVEFKVAAEALVTQTSDRDGYHYLFVDFPAGEYPLGGEWGGRPSFSGVGERPKDQDQVIDSEIPPTSEPQEP